VEERRWGDNTNHKDFRHSVFALQSTAVIGRVPRWAVDKYLHAATKARRESRAMGFDENGPVWVGDDEQEAVVRRALDNLTYVIWHPIFGRLRRHLRRDHRSV